MESWKNSSNTRELSTKFTVLYGSNDHCQVVRYTEAIAFFLKQFGSRSFALVSVPGRTELIGNHTDHQGGCVLAASITLDMLAVVSPNNAGNVRIFSDSYGPMELECSDLIRREGERNTSLALVRGVLAGLKEKGYFVGGFYAYITSNIPIGSGLSSSAAFEVLIGTICSYLYNANSIPAITLAQIGKYAENKYFGKPCGLMDQMASAVGGITHMNFFKPDDPKVKRIANGFNGYTLGIINAGGNHADFTSEYAAIIRDMQMVANYLGLPVLGKLSSRQFYQILPDLRGRISDRALLRAMHFFEENTRVPLQALALCKEDMLQYIYYMNASGGSSLTMLQNVYPISNAKERSVLLALSLAAQWLRDKGAWRVHGGGFVGTVQVLVPAKSFNLFRKKMIKVFGKGSCYPISIRPIGAQVILMEDRK